MNEARTIVDDVLLQVPAFREGANLHPGGMEEISRGQSRAGGCSPRNKIDKSLRAEGAPEFQAARSRKWLILESVAEFLSILRRQKKFRKNKE
jgi:hypothetical protein